MAAKKKAKKAAKKKATAKKKTVKKTAKKAAAKKAPAKPAKKAKKASKKKVAKAPVRKKAVKKKKQIVGEGDYAATRAFDKDQASFVRRNKTKIPELGKEAEAALDGPEGDALRDAEASAAGRSRDTFEP